MMSRNEKISLLMSLSSEVEFFIDEVKNFVPSLLTERYKMSGTEYIDTLVSIVDVEKSQLEKSMRAMYDKHLDDEELENLISLCENYTKIEIDPALFDALEDVKNAWFDAFVFRVDLIMEKMQDGDFSN